jgi:hypothetical protein
MRARQLVEAITEAMDLEAKLIKAARSIKHCGDYGQLYFNPRSKAVHWTMADSDGDPEYSSSDEIRQLLKLPGITHVELGDEWSPDEDDGWRRLKVKTDGVHEAVEDDSVPDIDNDVMTFIGASRVRFNVLITKDKRYDQAYLISIYDGGRTGDQLGQIIDHFWSDKFLEISGPIQLRLQHPAWTLTSREVKRIQAWIKAKMAR